MIHGIYGLAHLGLSHFNSLCKQEKIAYAVISPQGVQKMETGEDVEPYPVVVLSVVNFLKVHRRLKNRKVCVFIVDNPVQLESIDATILGCTKRKTYQYTFFPVRSSDIRTAIESCGKEPVEFKLKRTRVIYDLMQAAAAESIMSPLQTAFYMIKNVEDRTKTQDTIFDWLSGRVKDEKVRKILNSLSSEEVQRQILGLIETKPFLTLRKAAQAVMDDGMKFETASTKFKVPMYDLKYVCKKSAIKLNLVLPG